MNPTSSLSCHVSCADFFRRRALFLPLTRRPRPHLLGDPPPAPVRTFVRCYKCSFVQLYVCASLCRIPYYLYLSRSIFFVRILVSCLTLFFLVLRKLFCCFICPLYHVATRRKMLVFPTFCAVSALSRFAIQLNGVYSESHQANDNEEKGETRRRIRRPGRQPGSPEESAAWTFDN